MMVCAQRIGLLSLTLLPLYGCLETEPSQSLTVAQQGLYSAAIASSSTKSLSVVGSINHGASLWNVLEQERLFNWNHDQGQYTEMAVSDIANNANVALTTDHQRFSIWNALTGESIGFSQVDSRILTATLSQNGQHTIIGLSNFNAIVINNVSLQVNATLPHTGYVRSVALRTADDDKPSTGSIALTGSDDRKARLWNSDEQILLAERSYPTTVNHVSLSNTGAWSIISSQHDQWAVIDNKAFENEPVLSKQLKSVTITASAFSKSDELLLLGTSNRRIELWSISEQRLIDSWLAPKKSAWSPFTARILAVGFTADESAVIAATTTGKIHTWAIEK